MSIVCEAIIFDLDGVLADSNAVVERHLRIWADRQGIAFDRVLEVHHGRRTVETLALLAPGLDAKAEALRIEEVAADDTEGVFAFAGATRLLGGLPAGQWAIATSGTSRIARKRIAHLGFPVPPVFVTADDVLVGKPAPDPYFLAAARLGVDPSRCVVVEDSPAGVEAGLAAGARVIGVAATLPAELLMAAHVVVDRLDALEVFSHGERLEVTWSSALHAPTRPDAWRTEG